MKESALALDSLFTSLFPSDGPGAAVLVLEGDKIVYDKGFGLARLSDCTKIDGNTFFNIASCSKQFTAVAVLQLAQAGRISLEDNVNKYFPEFTDPIWNDIKIKHLLSHSSGIPDERGYLTREQRINGDEDLATEYLMILDHLHFAPGTQYEYINPTFVLLGKLVERVSGVEFTKYVHDNIFAPAGMDQTLYFDRDHQDLIPNMAHGYEFENVEDMPEERTATASDGPKNWYEYDFGEETFFATRPDGGIYTSTHQFALWEKALREGKVLGKEWLQQAWTPHTVVSGSEWSDYQNRPGTWYGYGWFIEPRGEIGKESWAEVGSESLAGSGCRAEVGSESLAGSGCSAEVGSESLAGSGCSAEVGSESLAGSGCSAEEQGSVAIHIEGHGPVIYHTGDNGGFKILEARYPSSNTLVLVFANRADWDRYEVKTAIETILGL